MGSNTPPFTFHPSLSPFNISPQEYMSSHPTYNALVTGGMIFHPSSPTPKILLICRAASDFMPNLWEIPGGSCELSDPTILHGLVREVYEESGLRVVHVEKLESERCFRGSKHDWGQKVYGKFEFVVLVEVERDGEELKVVIDENEHSAWRWVSEDECREGRIDEKDGTVFKLEITMKEQREAILDAFRHRIDGGSSHI